MDIEVADSFGGVADDQRKRDLAFETWPTDVADAGRLQRLGDHAGRSP